MNGQSTSFASPVFFFLGPPGLRHGNKGQCLVAGPPFRLPNLLQEAPGKTKPPAVQLVIRASGPVAWESASKEHSCCYYYDWAWPRHCTICRDSIIRAASTTSFVAGDLPGPIRRSQTRPFSFSALLGILGFLSSLSSGSPFFISGLFFCIGRIKECFPANETRRSKQKQENGEINIWVSLPITISTTLFFSLPLSLSTQPP